MAPFRMRLVAAACRALCAGMRYRALSAELDAIDIRLDAVAHSPKEP